MNKFFYFNSNKDIRKDKKTFKTSLIRKLISLLNVQVNKRKYEKPFKSNSWSDSETLNEKELKLQP